MCVWYSRRLNANLQLYLTMKTYILKPFILLIRLSVVWSEAFMATITVQWIRLGLPAEENIKPPWMAGSQKEFIMTFSFFHDLKKEIHTTVQPCNECLVNRLKDMLIFTIWTAGYKIMFDFMK